jgi:hypothetical protein
MKNLILLMLLSLAFTARAQTVIRDSANRDSCNCYWRHKDPKQINPYAFAYSAKAKKPAAKAKKKQTKCK